MTDIFSLKVEEIVSKIKDAQLTSVEVCQKYIERINKFNFALKVYEPISYSKDETIHNITSDLNKILEKMILKNPEQWIWSHNRWKV